jgi:hypothetical protein
MATFTKLKLSGCTDGRPIKVVQTATAGDPLHTAHATALDEVWLYAVNTSASDVLLTLEWGGVTDPQDLIKVTIPARSGLVQLAPGLILSNSVVVRAFAATANVINIVGWVNRIA